METQPIIRYNDEQCAIFDAALHTNENLLINALAGTGKTATALELARLLDGSCIVLAYGANAAGDMKRRLPEAGYPHVKIATTHSFFYGQWCRHVDRKVAVAGNKVRMLIESIADVQPLAIKYTKFLVALVSHAKRAGFGVMCTIERDANWRQLVERYGLGGELEHDDLGACIEIAKAIYKKSLDACKREVDFDDQILAPMYYEVRLRKFRNVILDEAQDTSPLRLDGVMRLVTSDGRFIAVGDPNQSIMGFTGAQNESMKEIADLTSPKVLTLNTSYRVPKSAEFPIRALVPGFTCADTNEMGTWEETWQTMPLDWPDHLPHPKLFDEYAPFTKTDAIICRNTRPLVQFAYRLIRQRIPCKIEGRAIGDGLVAFVKGFKCSDLGSLYAKVQEHKRKEYHRLLELRRDGEAESIADRCDTILTLTDEVMKESSSVTALVMLLTNMFGDTPEGQDPNCVTLSTVHKSKGREWPRVFCLGLDELMPSASARQPWELKQEWNLKYVAMSRHKQHFINVHLDGLGRKGKGSANNDNRREKPTAY